MISCVISNFESSFCAFAILKSEDDFTLKIFEISLSDLSLFAKSVNLFAKLFFSSSIQKLSR